MPIPPNRSIGDAGHVNDHNDIRGVLNTLTTDKANLVSPTFTGTVVLPSTTSIGNVSSTELGYLDGVTSAIQTQINTVGLNLITSQTFTGAGTINVNNVFTSSYRNYRIVSRGTHTSTGALALISFRFRVSGADNATANYQNMALQLTQAGGPNRFWNPGLTYTNVAAAGNVGFAFSTDVFTPQIAANSHINSMYQGFSGGAVSTGTETTTFSQTTQFDGFSIFVSSGSLTGTVSVYGYKD